MNKSGKIVVAYSGGLDTSVMIKWLKEKYDAEIIAYTANVGQGGEWDQIKEKALKTGADKVYVEDLQEEFARDYVLQSLKANCLYEGKYPLATALSRPLIAKRMVEVANQEGATAVAHGCTGKGNDQVRFDVSFRALNPDLDILAPLRFWEFKTRNDEIDYALKHNIPVQATKKSPYSIDQNLWGISIECGELENPWIEPPVDAFQWTTAPEQAPDQPVYLTINFEKGVPVGLNGEQLDLVSLIKQLNQLGSEHGVGRIDMVENRLVGIKSREIYETPAAVIMTTAHQELENLVLDRETLHFKTQISQKYANLIYFGLWYSPLRTAFAAFVEETQQFVTGEVRVKLYKGQSMVVGRKSPYSLYQHNLATYDQGDQFDHNAASGFIKLWGLPTEIHGRIQKHNK